MHMMSTCTARLVAYLTPPSSLGGPRDRFAGDSAGGSPFSWSASSLGACLDLAASTSCAARSSLSRRKKSDAVKASLPRWSLHRSSKLTTRSHASTSSALCLWHLANCKSVSFTRMGAPFATYSGSGAGILSCQSTMALSRTTSSTGVSTCAPPGAHGRWRGSVRLRKHVGDSVALVECVALAPATAERYGELRAHAGRGGTIAAAAGADHGTPSLSRQHSEAREVLPGHPLGLAVKDPTGEVGSVAHGGTGATPHRVGNARTGLMQELALLFESVRAGCAEPVGTLR
mmetsp:Transcript_13021/g.54548  ORF Transcript_13021/g.54548 Transcript_13021/m.54548 type:complete len:288 (-) Transcript_13021:312-1175(-)